MDVNYKFIAKCSECDNVIWCDTETKTTCLCGKAIMEGDQLSGTGLPANRNELVAFVKKDWKQEVNLKKVN